MKEVGNSELEIERLGGLFQQIVEDCKVSGIIYTLCQIGKSSQHFSEACTYVQLHSDCNVHIYQVSSIYVIKFLPAIG